MVKKNATTSWPYLPLTRIHPASMMSCPHPGQYRMCPHLVIMCSQVSAACLLLLMPDLGAGGEEVEELLQIPLSSSWRQLGLEK